MILILNKLGGTRGESIHECRPHCVGNQARSDFNSIGDIARKILNGILEAHVHAALRSMPASADVPQLSDAPHSPVWVLS